MQPYNSQNHPPESYTTVCDAGTTATVSMLGNWGSERLRDTPEPHARKCQRRDCAGLPECTIWVFLLHTLSFQLEHLPSNRVLGEAERSDQMFSH